MTNKDRIGLFDNAIYWIFEHCENSVDGATALYNVGFSQSQAEEMLRFYYYGEELENGIKEVRKKQW